MSATDFAHTLSHCFLTDAKADGKRKPVDLSLFDDPWTTIEAIKRTFDLRYEVSTVKFSGEDKPYLETVGRSHEKC